MKLMKISLVILVSLSLVSCFTQTTKKGTVGVERNQIMTVSAKEMTKGANKAYKEVLAEAKKQGNLNPDEKQLKRVREIADRLIPHTKVYRKDAPKWDWQVNVIQSDQLNAWCMPGGKIAFYTGIIDKLSLTDGEIAAIMGHEIAHALREHGRERASQAQIQSVGLQVIGAVAGLDTHSHDMAAMALNVTLTLPNSRAHETEADRMGVELAARAGFDPYDAVKVWEKMSKMSGGSTPEILSTHPAHDTRISDLKRYSKKVNHLYEAANRS